MTGLVAFVNILLGCAYTGYGVMTAVEMKRDWRSFGFSHFGAAWIFMAFTCGPHHLVHGLGIAFGDHSGGALDLFAVVVGLPVGVTWLLLRVEAFFGGRGDRYIYGTPAWLQLMPMLSATYLVVLGAGAGNVFGNHASGHQGHPVSGLVVANGVLVVLYIAIGWYVLRTQLANRDAMAGWSTSGLCLSVIFPTCALMHGVHAVYELSGRYHASDLGTLIDWLSIPAALYFLWVVHGLYRDALHDWNEGPDVVPAELAGVES